MGKISDFYVALPEKIGMITFPTLSLTHEKEIKRCNSLYKKSKVKKVILLKCPATDGALLMKYLL